MADDVWAWCEKTDGHGLTVTVKIKWADFQQSTRSQSLGRTTQGDPGADPVDIPAQEGHPSCRRDPVEFRGATR